LYPLKFVCEAHGEVEAQVNLNFDAFCPLCLKDQIERAAETGVLLNPLPWGRNLEVSFAPAITAPED
jgi:hypothetical protein